MFHKILLSTAIAVTCHFAAHAQDAENQAPPTLVTQTFKDTRLVNIASVELIEKGKLDVRLMERFGVIGTLEESLESFFGLESMSDIMVALQYGATENLTVGLSRSKGNGFMPDQQAGLRQLLNGTLKYRVLQQAQGSGSPVTLTVQGMASFSTMKKDKDDPEALNSFPKFMHRLAYHSEVLVSRKFSDRLSVQVSPAFTHRNLVHTDDTKNIFSVGVGARVQLLKGLGLVGDAVFPIGESRNSDHGFYPIYGLGLEVTSGCNTFHVGLSSAVGLTETDYIPYNTGQWSDGDFRLGFTVSRAFDLKKKQKMEMEEK